VILPSTRAASLDLYRRALSSAFDKGIQDSVERELALNDLFFLLVYVLGRTDINRDWLFERCREVQAEPNGRLDLWPREHGKSSIITFALTVQNILADPELTVGIFSFNRPTAKAFLRQIKREFEANEKLRRLFPDILWENPHRDAPKWSEDDGIVLKRKGNPKESTVEAWGLVEGAPTSKHFGLMVYDDVVTRESVTTPEMIRKVTEAWELSLALTSDGGNVRYIGTRYHYNDTYRTILDRAAAIERRHTVTKDGTVDGEPVLWTRDQVAKRRREQGPYVFSSQMLLDPAADRAQGFHEEWLREYTFRSDSDYAGMNKYLLVDAANSRKKGSDYTAMVMIGLGSDQNYYLLDGIRDRLNLRERGDAVFALHRRWRPIGVGYEEYGLMADIEYVKERQKQENYRFEVTKLAGRMEKNDRIRRMIPVFEAGRFWLPEHLLKVDYEGRHVDLVQTFINEEYKPFPVGLHDDFFDALSRIADPEMGLVWPKPVGAPEDRYARPRNRTRRHSSWAA
jgi:phage terminase large subunit-like protein